VVEEEEKRTMVEAAMEELEEKAGLRAGKSYSVGSMVVQEETVEGLAVERVAGWGVEREAIWAEVASMVAEVDRQAVTGAVAASDSQGRRRTRSSARGAKVMAVGVVV